MLIIGYQIQTNEVVSQLKIYHMVLFTKILF